MIQRGQWLRIMTRDNWTCQKCGKSLEEDFARPQVGHVEAKSNGGKAVDSNLQAECGECNQADGNSTASANRGPGWWKKPREKSLGFFALAESRSLFQRTYGAYPVHVAEDSAEVAWRNAVARYSVQLAEERSGEPVSFHEAAEKILAAVQMYALSDSARKDGLRKTWRPPYLATWLNAGQYKDDPREWQKHGDDPEAAGRVAEKFSF